MFEDHEAYSDEKLAAVKQEYEDTIDQYTRWVDAVEEDLDYYHGSQWLPEDLEYLRKRGRPALTFNVLQAKILHLVGAQEDNAKEPIFVAEEPDDQLAADIMNILKHRIYEESDLETAEAMQFEDGVSAGIGSFMIDVEPDPEDVLDLRVNIEPLDPTEVLWDLNSRRKDRQDARYFFSHQWMTKSELRADYPELTEEELTEIFAPVTKDSGTGIAGAQFQRQITQDPQISGYMYRRRLLYWDTKRHEVRVIHMEHVEKERVNVLVVPDTGQQIEVTDEKRRLIERLVPGRYDFVEVYRDKYYWLDFVGRMILYDEESPMPYDGFSVVSYVCMLDRDNMPYGKVRGLKDPQKEVNKRHSQTLEMISRQGNPGLIAEVGALVDKTQAEEAMREGGVVETQSGKFDKVTARTVPAFPDAISRMMDTGLRMLDVISNVFVDEMQEPRGIPEAAATTQLKQRKSLLTTIPLLKQYHRTRKLVMKKIMQIPVRAMSDTQISRMLANERRFQVWNGIVEDASESGGGGRVFIRDVRQIRYNVDMLPAAPGSSEAIMHFQTLMAMAGAGMPVDPEVLFDLANLPPDKVARLKAFHRAQLQGQMRASEAETKQIEGQMMREFALDQGKLMIDAGKLEEDKRSNFAAEIQKGIGDTNDFVVGLAQIWFNADQNEKGRMTEVIREIIRAQQARGAAPQAIGG
jgi:hypothetical protein